MTENSVEEVEFGVSCECKGGDGSNYPETARIYGYWERKGRGRTRELKEG
jgi:hypothetical protein